MLAADGTSLIDLSESPLAAGIADGGKMLGALFTGIDHDWEIDPTVLRVGKKIGESGWKGGTAGGEGHQGAAAFIRVPVLWLIRPPIPWVNKYPHPGALSRAT